MEFEIRSFDCTSCGKEQELNSPLAVLNATTLNYNDFFTNYMHLNRPCIIRGISESWNCTKLWFSDTCLNYEYLRTTYGDLDVTVYDCQERYYNSHKTFSMMFCQYLDYFQEGDRSKLYYLKDWHLKNSTTDDSFYEWPIFFASDWLNEYSVGCLDDDYRFVYIGPKASWTPFHVDVFSSFSWSVNVFGKKRWIFLPPGEENQLRDAFGNLPFDLEEETLPVNHIEVVQETGDAIFVPSGWHHQVWNLEDTVSVNHNWVNGCNIQAMYDAMAAHLTAVRKEISDCADMPQFEEHCQLMLDASFGMNYSKFYSFLKFIALSRINMLRTQTFTLFHGHTIGRNHVFFDLSAISNVLNTFCESHEVLSLLENVDIGPIELLANIVNAIKDYSDV